MLSEDGVESNHHREIIMTSPTGSPSSFLVQQKLLIHMETLVLALPDGLEPPTLCFSGIHSSHLS